MAVYVIYDPDDGNKIRRWVQVLPEEIRSQRLIGNERIAWIGAMMPPTLGFVEKIFDPVTGEITDGAETAASRN